MYKYMYIKVVEKMAISAPVGGKIRYHWANDHFFIHEAQTGAQKRGEGRKKYCLLEIQGLFRYL